MTRAAEGVSTSIPTVRLRSVDDDLIRLAAPQARRPRVMVVDDDPAIRKLCALSLERSGLTVLESADGALALERARFERPDLIVTDVMMPGLDGFELADALRHSSRTKEIPLIFLSGGSAEGDETRAQSLGAIAFIRKPFDPGPFASLVA